MGINKPVLLYKILTTFTYGKYCMYYTLSKTDKCDTPLFTSYFLAMGNISKEKSNQNIDQLLTFGKR
jgi:hypothetical protein